MYILQWQCTSFTSKTHYAARAELTLLPDFHHWAFSASSISFRAFSSAAYSEAPSNCSAACTSHQKIRFFFITISTRFSCLGARCVCRQAAAKAGKILPLVGLARSKQDPINRGHGAQYSYCPPPAGAKIRYAALRQTPHVHARNSCRKSSLHGC